MNGRYERVVLDLEPWLRGELRKKGVPGAYHLKPLNFVAEAESEGEDDGGAEGVAADVRAEVMKKAFSVARDIESGRLERLPAKPEQYFRGVMWKALMDCLRIQPKPTGLSSDERAEIDNELSSVDKDEGDESFSALPPIHVPKGPREPARPPRPQLLTLVRHRFWWKPAVSAEYERAQQLLDAIPKEPRREIMGLYLQGYRQKQIAIKVLRTQQAVSKAIQEQKAAWGWDNKKVLRVQYLTAFANLVRLFGRVFPNEGFGFPRRSSQGFWESQDFKEEEGEWESEEERQADLRRDKEYYNVHGRSFELPRDDKAYERSRQPVLLTDLDLPIREEREQWKPGPRQESKERRQRQERLNRLRTQEAKVYQAIMGDPALATWTDGLKLRHMPQLITRMMGDDYYWYDYDDDDFPRLYLPV